jgi:hypothetical protein
MLSRSVKCTNQLSCANCGGNHPSSYFGCTVAKHEQQQKKSSFIQKHLSYAKAAAGKSYIQPSAQSHYSTPLAASAPIISATL